MLPSLHPGPVGKQELRGQGFAGLNSDRTIIPKDIGD